MRPSRMLLTVLFVLALAAAPAHAIIRLPLAPAQVAGNPAERLLSVPIEDSLYDPATHCSRKPRAGMVALQRWLGARARGVSWGTCRREAERLARLLLAPDSAGNPQALARRMGVEELIWDCGYWSAGMTQFDDYTPCFNRHGTRRKHVDPTVAHRNHIHIGLTRAGAARRTSFWSAAA